MDICNIKTSKYSKYIILYTKKCKITQYNIISTALNMYANANMYNK